mgnify:CR=1 FL=1
MKDSLVIRCRDIHLQAESLVEWFLFDSHHQMISRGRSELNELQQHLQALSSSYLISVIVPNDAVLLAQVNIPSNSSRQIKQALPFMAEELLLEEIENVHLAQAPQIIRPGKIELAIVAHSVLIKWLDVFHRCHLPPVSFVPESLALPYNTGEYSVVIENQQCIVRSGFFQGFCCHFDDLQPLLTVLLSDDKLSDNAVSVSYQIDDDNLIERFLDFELWHNSVEVEPLNYKESLSEVMAVTLIQQGIGNLNILQGGYSQQKTDVERLQHWRTVATAMVVGVLLVVASNLITGWYFQSQQKNSYQQSVALYKRYFPNEQRVVSPRRQMASKIKSGGAESEFLALVSQSAGSFNKMSSALNVEKLRYKSEQGQLQLELRSQSIEHLDQLKKHLAEQGINTTINSATEQDGYVMSRLQLGGF